LIDLYQSNEFIRESTQTVFIKIIRNTLPVLQAAKALEQIVAKLVPGKDSADKFMF
jgi:hypothetical protein